MTDEDKRKIAELEIKLVKADILAAAVDLQISRGVLDERSVIADARLAYGSEAFKYDHAKPEDIVEYRHGVLIEIAERIKP